MNKFTNLLCGFGLSLVCLTVPAQSSYSKDASQSPNIVLHLPIQTEELMPLADAIQADLDSRKLSRFHVRTAIYWHDYQQGLKLGRKGVYLAPPHFAAWAVHKHNFIPLVRLNEPLSYVIASDRTDRSLFEINDLANQFICSTKPLNLDYILINSTFEKSVMAAIPITVDSAIAEMNDSESQCKAFSVSDHALRDMAREGNSKFIRLTQSPSMKNYVLISHPAIAERQRLAIKNYFLQKSTKQLLMPIASQFSQNGSWVRAKKADYPKKYLAQLEKYWSQ